MPSISYVIMGIGIVFAIIGIILFIFKGAEGQNTLKFGGMEFNLSGSSLVFFVIGVVLLILPIAKNEWFIHIIPDNIDQNGIKAKEFIIKGDALWVNGKFDDVELAKSYYSQAIDLVNDHDRAIAQKAQAEIQLKEYIPATEDIKKAISLNPDTGAYYAILARIYLLRGDTSSACDEWQTAYENGYTKQLEYVSMFCNDTSKKKSVIDQKVDSQLVIDDDRPWILRCDFYDGGRSFVDRNDYIYLDYLGQLVQIGEKLPSSNPSSLGYSIQLEHISIFIMIEGKIIWC